MTDKVDATGEAVIAWKSKPTGFVGNGQPISVEDAFLTAEEANKRYPELDHVVVPAGKAKEIVTEMKKSS